MTALFSNTGYCILCDSQTTFHAEGSWLRDQYVCAQCRSIPRQRALVEVLRIVRPIWRMLRIHESSPSSEFFLRAARHYTYSFYFDNVPPGSHKDGLRCETLERLTFPNESFDLFITQDVLEHVFDPAAAFREIMRVLKDGGMHVFTTPKHKNLLQSRPRARLTGEKIEHLMDPQFHGNPIGDGKALVTWDYGADFEDLVAIWSGYLTSTYVLRDRNLGIDGEYLDVFVTVRNKTNHTAQNSSF